MSPEILGQMVGRTTSAVVWGCLTSMLSVQSRASVRQIFRQPTMMKMTDLSIADYFNRDEGGSDVLAMVGSPISDDELIDYIVVGLGSQFEAL